MQMYIKKERVLAVGSGDSLFLVSFVLRQVIVPLLVDNHACL